MKTYSNPRLTATIENWPHGARRVVAQFHIENSHDAGLQRAVRVTTGAADVNGDIPKKLTYAKQMRIVDGDDGRIYIAALTLYGHITIYKGDMKFSEETVFESDDRYSALRALFY